ncbi:MAG: ribonuclease P protein component [Gammaproteobacteria bacterium]|nr:ribonuclease P protein component [Gammaproteobacteria bacterium]
MIDRAGRFPANSKLTKPSEFQLAFKSRERSADGVFLVLARRNSLDRARLGCAFSKRWLARAVARNRLKRLVRESFREHYQELRGLDVVVAAQRDLSSIGNAELRTSLGRHWKKIAACATSSSK